MRESRSPTARGFSAGEANQMIDGWKSKDRWGASNVNETVVKEIEKPNTSPN